ncbi:tryptophan 7-halogenase [Aestuariibacter halophilus]|uniref:Tryptophan 7-halogenase n=1 Tax=Fluctibacter halophilus TaxID=226011 RepID=A0ABS8G9X0_9ALTE|nr:tryptophan halogenase family protein [Aestuariibacter halophilus]MCC2617303.1 tryptophan 7-halogenase [Aestuariibacter halophilus]
MTTPHHAINNIVVVGGGTAGWMTAAALSQHFRDTPVSLTLIESSQLGTVGVGEATIPTLRRFYAKLGLSDIDVINATDATCKLGIEFQDWQGDGKHFIHPFGLFGDNPQGINFQHYWLKGLELSEHADISAYSLGVNLARQNRFYLPNAKPQSRLEIFDWALHFDASKFAALMKTVAMGNGVKAIDGRIHTVGRHPNGAISGVQIEGREGVIEGDLFIDCSGFHGLLIDKTLNTPYVSWQQWLLCDSAVSVQTSSTQTPLNRTIARAKQAGWQWRIPLQSRQGNGYVYCSDVITPQQAEDSLFADVSGEALNSPRHFRFTPGRRDVAWQHNCVAIGLAAGFIEPLESTSIALIETAIEHLIQTFRQPHYNAQDVARFNEVTRDEYERVRDFIILHYALNGRTDSTLWQHCRQMTLPDTLQDKMAHYQQQGEVKRLAWEIFGADSWIAVMHGMGFTPQQYDPRLSDVDEATFVATLQRMRQWIEQVCQRAPHHQDFLSYARHQATRSGAHA